MKNAIDIFSELNTRLLEGVPQQIAELAVSRNPWFTTQQIGFAAEAVRQTMLQADLLEGWLARYEQLPTERPQRVLIIMAGNLPFVGFFDLLCVLAAGHHAIVKPSHKDQVLMEWIIGEIIAIEPSVPIYIYNDNDGEKAAVDRIIATGGDAAVAHFEELYRGTPSLLRGSRHSAAIITNETSAEDLAKLSMDIYTHSGLGCRNVSLLFVPQGYGDITIPTPTVETNPKYTNNYLQTRAIYTLSSVDFQDNGHSCIVASEQFPASLSTIATIEYSSIEEVSRWLAEHDDELQCVVADSSTLVHPRRCDFGEAQRPTLYDYADGVDTMLFLN